MHRNVRVPGRVDKHFQEGFLDDMPYDIPNYLVDYAVRRTHVPVGLLALREPHAELLLQGDASSTSWRMRRARTPISTGASCCAIIRAPTNSSPCSTRPRTRRAGERRRREGIHRGIALNEVNGTYTAAVIEVSVGERAAGRIAWSAPSTAATVVNPLTVEMQVEGATVFALTAALYGEITIKDGRVEQSNFHDYPMLRLARCRRSRP